MYNRSTREDGSFTLQGYVIAGTPGSSNAYIVPIEDIQGSIESQIGSKLLLPIDIVEKRQVSSTDKLDMSRYSGIPSPPPDVASPQKVYALLQEMLASQQKQLGYEAEAAQSLGRKLFAPKPSVEIGSVASKLDSASFNNDIHRDYLTARISTPHCRQSIGKVPSTVGLQCNETSARYTYFCLKKVNSTDSVHRLGDLDDEVDHQSVESPSPERGLRRWHAVFETERRPNFGSFNLSWRVSRPFNIYDDPIDDFMQRKLHYRTPHTSILEQVNRRERYRALDTGFDRSKPALLIDGAFREFPGLNYRSLTAKELEEALGRPRFPQASKISREAFYHRSPGKMKCPSTVPGSPLEDAHEQDADRRIIYITDLDRKSITALIRTVSSHEADALRNCLCRHLTSDAYAGMTSSTLGMVFNYWARIARS